MLKYVLIGAILGAIFTICIIFKDVFLAKIVIGIVFGGSVGWFFAIMKKDLTSYDYM